MDKPDPLSSISLQKALEHYKKALEFLNHPQKLPILPEQALEILTARDALQRQLEAEKQIPVALLPLLIQLDSHLKLQAHQIIQILDLAQYRDTLLISSQAWWWNLEAQEISYFGDRFDWLLKGLRITAWTVNLGFLGTLATRFLSGGSGFFEIIAIAFPSILALLQAGSDLTRIGQTGFEKSLAKLKIPVRFYEEAKLISTLSLSGLLVVLWLNLPFFSQKYTSKGWQEQKKGQLASAEQNYLRAISLDPENLDAHFNLGYLYEVLQEADNAQKEYLLAAKGGLPEAYNQLGRLYIQNQKYSQAVILLKEGLAALNQKEQDGSPVSPAIKYSLFKNLGWARVMQNQDEAALPFLTVALSISDNSDTIKYLRNPGAAHCLYAQILERQKKPKALKHWQQCRDLIEAQLAAGEAIYPEEDTWLDLSKKKLKIRRN